MQKPNEPPAELTPESVEKLLSCLVRERQHYIVRKHYQINPLVDPPSIDPQLENLDIDDYLHTSCHQKKPLTEERWQRLNSIHKSMQIEQTQFKYFLMLASQASYRKLQHPGYYKQLLAHTKSYPKSFFVCIDKDTPRTLPDTHPDQGLLRNILYCYAIRNPSLLYCQGMNYLVAYLLMNSFSEEEAFWFLTTLIEDILTPSYFKDLTTISIATQIVQDILPEVFPNLAAEMEEVGMQSGVFVVSWFICLWTKGFINKVSEFLLAEIILGSRKWKIGFMLVKLTLSVISAIFINNKSVQFEKDFKSLKETLEKNAHEVSLTDLKQGMARFDFDYDAYKELQEYYLSKREKVFEEALNKELNQRKIALPHCNSEYPICMQRIEIQKKIGSIEEVLILKNAINIKEQYNSEYFPKQVNRGVGKIHYQSPNQCPIIHHSHICETTHKQMTKKLNPRMSIQLQKSMYSPLMNEGESSQQIKTSFSKIQDRYNELSSFFVVSQCDIEELEEFSNEESLCYSDSNQMNRSEKQQTNLVLTIGNVLKKAFKSINLLKLKHDPLE